MPKKKKSKVTMESIVGEEVAEAEEEYTAEEIKYVATPYFAFVNNEVQQRCALLAANMKLPGNHASVNLAKKEMMTLHLDMAQLGDYDNMAFLGRVRGPNCIF